MDQQQQSGLRRREMLRRMAALLPGCLLSGGKRADGSEPSSQFPTEPRARLSVTSYPFRTLIDSPTNKGKKSGVPSMDMKAFPAFVAEQFRVYNVNPLLSHFSSTDAVYLDSFRAELEKAKSHIVDLGLAGKRFYANDPAVRSEAVAFGKKCVDIASGLGSPSVRQHVEGDNAGDIGLAAESLGELAEYGGERNVVINLENDNAVAENPFFLVAVIEKVNNPYLRALPDFGNSLLGHDEAFNNRAVAAMLSHSFNMCHVKNLVAGHTGKLQRVDLKQMFQLAKQQNFRGYFSMEYETQAGDPIAGTKQLVEESLKWLS